MKQLIVLSMILSGQALASVAWTCTNPADETLTYTVIANSWNDHRLLVTKRELVPDSCRTRWGCDFETKTILDQKVKYTEFQGVAVYTGHNSKIVIGDGDSDTFRYTGARLKSGDINCQ